MIPPLGDGAPKKRRCRRHVAKLCVQPQQALRIAPTASDNIGDQHCAGVCLAAANGFNNGGPKVTLDYITSRDGAAQIPCCSPKRSWRTRQPPDRLTVLALIVRGERAGDKPLSLGYCSVSSLGMEVEVGFDWKTFSTSPKINDKLLSNHSGGTINVSFCDGHQQPLSPTMDINTFIHLMTPYDHDCGDSFTTPNPWTNAPQYIHGAVLNESMIGG